MPAPTTGVTNFGWPCYQGEGGGAGSTRQSGYDAANLSICETLYGLGQSAVQAPFYAWNHSARVVSGETCPTGSSSAAGIAFGAQNGSYPAEYRAAVLRGLFA